MNRENSTSTSRSNKRKSPNRKGKKNNNNSEYTQPNNTRIKESQFKSKSLTTPKKRSPNCKKQRTPKKLAPKKLFADTITQNAPPFIQNNNPSMQKTATRKRQSKKKTQPSNVNSGLISPSQLKGQSSYSQPTFVAPAQPIFEHVQSNNSNTTRQKLAAQSTPNLSHDGQLRWASGGYANSPHPSLLPEPDFDSPPVSPSFESRHIHTNKPSNFSHNRNNRNNYDDSATFSQPYFSSFNYSNNAHSAYYDSAPEPTFVSSVNPILSSTEESKVATVQLRQMLGISSVQAC